MSDELSWEDLADKLEKIRALGPLQVREKVFTAIGRSIPKALDSMGIAPALVDRVKPVTILAPLVTPEERSSGKTTARLRDSSGSSLPNSCAAI